MKNKLKRYTWIHELELDIESMNKEWWVVNNITDNWNRILVVFMKEDTPIEEGALPINNIEDVWEDETETQDDEPWTDSL